MEPTNPPLPRTHFFKTLRNILCNWWLLLATGILLLGVGVWVLYSPFQSYLALSWVFAVGMVGTGVLDILFAVNNRQSKRWVWWLLAGIADIFIGIYLFNEILITMVFLPLVIGLWIFYKAFMAIGDALHVRSYRFGDWRRLLFMALVTMLMAALVLACPVIGIENIFLFSGLAFIAAGMFRIFWALKLQRFTSTFRKQAGL